MKTFKFLADPGHGWLRVSLADLLSVDLSLDKITRYSYRKGDTLYLEEDCDATTFVEAFEKKFGSKPNFSESHTNRSSFVRRLPPIH